MVISWFLSQNISQIYPLVTAISLANHPYKNWQDNEHSMAMCAMEEMTRVCITMEITTLGCHLIDSFHRLPPDL